MILTLTQCMSKRRALTDHYLWAIIIEDYKLSNKYTEEKKALDLYVIEHFSEEDAFKYFRSTS